MGFIFSELAATAALFVGMLAGFEVGRRIGQARLKRDPDGHAKGSGPVEAAVFGLLGLLLAFTFSGAASRFEERRHLITTEANAIGTAYLRLDLLPADAQPELRQLFREYLALRAQVYRNAVDATATQARATEANKMQRKIWDKSLAAGARPEARPQATLLLVPALNEMIDITTTRAVATQNHPPMVIFVLLAVLSVVSALLAGYVMCNTQERSWFYMLLLAATLSLTLYVILELEYPRSGLIRIDQADQTLIDLQGQMQ